jgi:hypothetical protein
LWRNKITCNNNASFNYTKKISSRSLQGKGREGKGNACPCFLGFKVYLMSEYHHEKKTINKNFKKVVCAW